jgi:hypothetical protein
MSNDELVCGQHGKTPVRFVCRHARDGVACGWHLDEEGDLALCDRCVTLPFKKVKPDIAVLCTYCWAEARVRNEDVPAFARPTNDDERAALQHHASHELIRHQDEAQAKWKVGLGEHATVFMRWDLDVEAGTLTFSDDHTRIVANTRFVGSWSSKSDSFQWAWVTIGEASPLAIDSARLRAFGEIRGIDDLAHMSWRGKLDRGWEMAALAGYLLGCEAAYRFPQEHLYWYVLLDKFRHE